MVTIRQALLSVKGEDASSISPIVAALSDLGFDVDAEVSSAFRLLNAEQAAGLNLRQQLALKAAIQVVLDENATRFFGALHTMHGHDLLNRYCGNYCPATGSQLWCEVFVKANALCYDKSLWAVRKNIGGTVRCHGKSGKSKAESRTSWCRTLGCDSATESADSGTSNAAAGLPACKLQLRRDSQNQDLFFFEPMDTNSTAAAVRAGVSSRFFLDPEGRQIDELQKWLGLVEDEHRNGRPIPPLIINGLIKSGKSYMLKEVLPAVANTYYSSGRQHAGTVLSEPNFLHVKCLTLDRLSGSSVFLQEFLIKLKRSAADQQLSAAASTPAPSDNSAGAVVDAIQDFMWRLPRDRLNFLLIDEAQSFYLLKRSMWDDFSGDGFSPRGSTLDMDEVQLMRRIFKKLLLDSPHWVAWAITGSGMATLWANIAATP
ncbi:hypothetical protein VOLCADRAFT_108613, partial [Volvox carteri f. nagariensis]